MKRIFILFLILIVQLAVNAQTPGYFGKKYNIGYNTALGVIPYEYYQIEQVHFFGNSQHELDVSYTVAHNKTIGLKLTTLSVDGRNIKNNHNCRINSVTGKSILFVFRKYVTGIAPIGTYWGFFGGMNFIEYDYANLYQNEIKTKNPFSVPRLGIEYGKNIIITDGLYIKVGASLGLTGKDYSWNATFRRLNYFRAMFGIGYIPF